MFCVKLVGKVRQLIRLCSNAPVASFLWTYFRSMLGWSLSPTSMERLFVDLLDHLKGKLRSIYHFKTRNNVFFKSTTKLWRLLWTMLVLHKTVMLIKTWKPLLKPKSKLKRVPNRKQPSRATLSYLGHHRTAVVGEATAL